MTLGKETKNQIYTQIRLQIREPGYNRLSVKLYNKVQLKYLMNTQIPYRQLYTQLYNQVHNQKTM